MWQRHRKRKSKPEGRGPDRQPACLRTSPSTCRSYPDGSDSRRRSRFQCQVLRVWDCPEHLHPRRSPRKTPVPASSKGCCATCPKGQSCTQRCVRRQEELDAKVRALVRQTPSTGSSVDSWVDVLPVPTTSTAEAHRPRSARNLSPVFDSMGQDFNGMNGASTTAATTQPPSSGLSVTASGGATGGSTSSTLRPFTTITSTTTSTSSGTRPKVHTDAMDAQRQLAQDLVDRQRILANGATTATPLQQIQAERYSMAPPQVDIPVSRPLPPNYQLQPPLRQQQQQVVQSQSQVEQQQRRPLQDIGPRPPLFQPQHQPFSQLQANSQQSLQAQVMDMGQRQAQSRPLQNTGFQWSGDSQSAPRNESQVRFNDQLQFFDASPSGFGSFQPPPSYSQAIEQPVRVAQGPAFDPWMGQRQQQPRNESQYQASVFGLSDGSAGYQPLPGSAAHRGFDNANQGFADSQPQGWQPQMMPGYQQQQVSHNSYQQPPYQRMANPGMDLSMPPATFGMIINSIPKFKGLPEQNVETWTDLFRCTTQVMTEYERGLALQQSLIDRAGEWYRDQMTLDNQIPRRASTAEWMGRLVQQFSQPPSDRRQAAERRHQQLNEPASTFCTDLRHLLLSYDPRLREVELVRILRKQIHPSYRYFFDLNCDENATWEQAKSALSRAMQFAQTYPQSQPQTGPQTSNPLPSAQALLPTPTLNTFVSTGGPPVAQPSVAPAVPPDALSQAVERLAAMTLVANFGPHRRRDFSQDRQSPERRDNRYNRNSETRSRSKERSETTRFQPHVRFENRPRSGTPGRKSPLPLDDDGNVVCLTVCLFAEMA